MTTVLADIQIGPVKQETGGNGYDPVAKKLDEILELLKEHSETLEEIRAAQLEEENDFGDGFERFDG